MATAATSVERRSPEVPSGMSYEEFLNWLDEDVRAEWVDGEVILMSPASFEHQALVTFLLNLLSAFVQSRGLGEVLPGPFQMKLPVRPSGREPDILFVAKARCVHIRKTYLDGPADLVVEVISPESRGRDTFDKRTEYEQSGVKEYWLVDPERRELTIFRKKGRHFAEERLLRGRFASTILAGFWLEVDWLWRKRLPAFLTVLQAWGAERQQTEK
jgi:Uma2 family endonuclease